MTARLLVCGFCAEEFQQDWGQPVCRACPLAGLCRMVRCPHCGYENPMPPAWIERLLHRESAR